VVTAARAVTTTEGLGGSTHPDGFHPIHERIAGFNGSQCGFCTPGMVMTLYVRAACTPREDVRAVCESASITPLRRYSALKAAEQRGDDIMGLDIESLFDGNLCRCTGYVPCGLGSMPSHVRSAGGAGCLTCVPVVLSLAATAPSSTQPGVSVTPRTSRTSCVGRRALACTTQSVTRRRLSSCASTSHGHCGSPVVACRGTR